MSDSVDGEVDFKKSYFAALEEIKQLESRLEAAEKVVEAAGEVHDIGVPKFFRLIDHDKKIFNNLSKALAELKEHKG